VFKNFRAASGEGSSCPTSSPTPHRCAGVRNRPGTLLPPRSKSQNSRRTWLRRSPLSFLNGHVLLHAARSPRERNRLHHQRDPAQGRQVSSSGWGSTSNSNGTRLVKLLAFGACAPSYAESRTYGCGFLSTRVLLSWRLSRLSIGLYTRSPGHGLLHVLVNRRIGDF